jgi:hypothetical protein
MKLSIDIRISREGLIVLSDILEGVRCQAGSSKSVRYEWHSVARKLVDQGLLMPWDDACYYQLTDIGRAVLAAVGR